MSPEFLLTSLIVVASPGTGVLYTLAAALSRGGRAGVLAAFASTLGIVPHIAAALLGLAAILHTSALLFQTVKYLGVAYLLYMAWQTFRQRGALKVADHVDARSARDVIVTGILINILNPKLSIFFLAFLPQFIAAGDPAPLQTMLFLSAVFMLMTFAVFAVYGLLAASVRGWLFRIAEIPRSREPAGLRRVISRARFCFLYPSSKAGCPWLMSAKACRAWNCRARNSSGVFYRAMPIRLSTICRPN